MDDARLEAEILLGSILDLNRVGLYVNLCEPLSDKQTTAFSGLIWRRLNHEPSAYVTNSKGFFGLNFQVDPSVFIPRPETELLVEKAIELVKTMYPRHCVIADIGTGCGAIAVALAANIPHLKIFATDISPNALQIAHYNCVRHRVSDRVTILEGNLVDPLPEPVHIILANLPYIREDELCELSPEISIFEPKTALVGGIDGLRIIEKFIFHAGQKLLPNGSIILEIGHDQGKTVCGMARERYPGSRVSITTDLNGRDRVVSIVSGR